MIALSSCLRRASPPACLLVFVLLLSGCSPAEPIGRVEGRVTFQGEPVAGACILFQNTTKGVYIMADLDQDGRYLVQMDKGYGLPHGDYEISLSPPPPKQTFGPEAPPPTDNAFPNIPPRYRQPKTSGITLQVKDGVNRLDVEMKD